MSISTGKGDKGDTGLVDGSRIPKNALRIEAYGTVDELNAIIGVIRSVEPDSPIDSELETISRRLFDLGCDLATPKAGLEETSPLLLSDDAIAEADAWIQREESNLPRLKSFILPGGTLTASHLHQARTVCRRAERHVVTHHQQTGEGAQAIVFLNRLSDLFFLYARRANRAAGVPDVEWKAST